MLKVDSSEVIISETVLLIVGKSALVEKTWEGARLVFELKFEHQPIDADRAKWRLENGIIKMTFYGWGNNSIGTAAKEPIKLGDVNGKPLTFMAAVFLVGDVHVVHFQVMVGGSNG